MITTTIRIRIVQEIPNSHFLHIMVMEHQNQYIHKQVLNMHDAHILILLCSTEVIKRCIYDRRTFSDSKNKKGMQKMKTLKHPERPWSIFSGNKHMGCDQRSMSVQVNYGIIRSIQRNGDQQPATWAAGDRPNTIERQSEKGFWIWG